MATYKPCYHRQMKVCDLQFYLVRKVLSPGYSAAVPVIFLNTMIPLDHVFGETGLPYSLSNCELTTLGVLEFSDFFQSVFSDTRQF